MNIFNFLITRQLVQNKTGDTDRANKLGLMTSFIPGPWGMMMGVLLADREQPAKPASNGETKDTPTVTRSLPGPSSGGPTAR